MSEDSVRKMASKIQNLSFQLILINLIPPSNVIQEGGSIKLSINRGKQIFEQTKNIPIQANTGIIPLNRSRLNFMVFSYDSTKVYQFNLRINQFIMGEQKCIGEYLIDCNSYAQTFLKSGNGAFQQILHLNETQKIQMEVYVEKNRFALQKLVRELTNPKDKSNIQIQPHTYQKITPKSAIFERQISLSPKRQNPFKRNSPKKLTEEQSSPIKQQLMKELQINNKTSNIEIKQEIKQRQANVNKIQISKQDQQKVISEVKPIEIVQSTQNEQKLVISEQNTHNDVKVPEDIKSVSVSKDQITKVNELKSEFESLDTLKEAQLSKEQAKITEYVTVNQQQVVLTNIDEQIAIEKQIVNLKQQQSQQPIEPIQFKIDEAAELLKRKEFKLSHEEQIAHLNKQADRPTLHSINAQITPQKQPLQSANNQQHNASAVHKIQFKRVFIFQNMPLKLKILLASLMIIFLVASNYVEEKNSPMITDNLESSIKNETITPKILPKAKAAVKKKTQKIKKQKQK